jgi:hypothetical protein
MMTAGKEGTSFCFERLRDLILLRFHRKKESEKSNFLVSTIKEIKVVLLDKE